MITYEIKCKDCEKILGSVELPESVDPDHVISCYLCEVCGKKSWGWDVADE
jgi:hypothetical protein